MSRRSAALARALPAVALLLLAGFAMVRTCSVEAAVPTADEWLHAAAFVRSQKSAAELVVIAPDWLDPVGRAHLGELITLADATRADAARYAGIWEVARGNARHRDTTSLTPSLTRRFGALTVRRYPQVPVGVITDFATQLAVARVEGNVARGPAFDYAEVGFAPHRCVIVTPVAGGQVKLHFAAMALGSSLVGYVGLADVFTRRDVRNPGAFTVLVDGEVKTQLQVGVDDGWLRWTAPTTAGPHEVTVVVAAVGKGARDRNVCWNMEARQ